MWMNVHIYSVEAKSQAGNTWVKAITTTQKGQSQKNLVFTLKNTLKKLPQL